MVNKSQMMSSKVVVFIKVVVLDWILAASCQLGCCLPLYRECVDQCPLCGDGRTEEGGVGQSCSGVWVTVTTCLVSSQANNAQSRAQ